MLLSWLSLEDFVVKGESIVLQSINKFGWNGSGVVSSEEAILGLRQQMV